MDHEIAVQNLAVESYLLGEMTPAEREAFEDHYFQCAICAEDLRAASQFLEDAREIWATEKPVAVPAVATPAREPSRSIRDWFAWLQPQVAAPALAALLLLAGGAMYQSLRLQTQLSEAITPRAVPYTVLRPPTRGDATVVTAVPGDSVILQFDLPNIPSQEWQFVVKSADDSVVLQMDGDALMPGDLVTLSIPRFDLPPGRYDLVVENLAASGEADREAARYPLEVRRP
jgi:hypothetical protein